jgi:hypothetical protein
MMNVIVAVRNFSNAPKNIKLTKYIREALRVNGLIQIYAPTQDSEDIEKEIFYNILQQTAEKAREYARHVVVMGDWNAPVGEQIERGCGTIGLYPAESIYNGNGDNMINFLHRQ